VRPAIIKSVEVKLPPALGGKTYAGWSDVVQILKRRGATVPSYWNLRGWRGQIDVVIVYASIYHQEFRARLRS
jgi:hypothetical protein